MTLNGWLQILFFLLAIFLVTPVLGGYMARVFNRQRTFLDPVMRPLERLVYRLTGVNEAREMRWTEYSVALLLFSVVSMLVLYVMQRVQAVLPFNPQGFAGVAPDLAFNTAASFTTNTNWQAYSGESTMSYFTQMAGLAYHNFVSAAVGISVAIAFIRGIAQKEKDTIGNFWVDLVRASLWVLLPISIVGALFLVSQGVVQNLKPYDKVAVVDPQTVTTTGADGKPQSQKVTEQTIAQGPIASQEIIKQFGTNGGGFLNANSAHPFENPTPLTNFLAMFGIFAISSGLTYTLGSMTGSKRHGWAVWAAMAFLFLAGVTTAYWAEARGNPMLTAAGADQTTTATSPGGNMEGKEVRFGIANTALFATVTTDASCGAINGWHDSFTPLGGLVPLANIELSEVVFGGVGAGMYGVLVYIILSVFIAGLMVGPNTGISRQEDSGVRGADGHVDRADLLAAHPGLHGDVIGVAELRDLEHLQPRPARVVRNALRLLVGRGEQRLGVRRHQREHPLVQHDARVDDAVRTVLHDHSAAGDRWKPEPEEEDSRVARHVPRDDAALHGVARRRDRDRRGADVLPGAQPGPDR